MSISDALRWNARYREPANSKPAVPRELLVKFYQYIPPAGFVLDVAMGLGGNACFLVKNGFQVLGVDLSPVAVKRAKNECDELLALVADSNEMIFPSNTFDAILNFYYLDRSILNLYKTILKPGGLLFFETPGIGTSEIDRTIEKKYLLQKNELLITFASWDILYWNKVIIKNSTKQHKVIEKMVLRKV